MAVATLSPWPSSPVALTAATECLKTALGEDDDATAQRLGSVAAELVERYASGAPQVIRNEAVVRCDGLDAPSRRHRIVPRWRWHQCHEKGKGIHGSG